MTITAQSTEVAYGLAGTAVGPFSTVWFYEQATDVQVRLNTGAGFVLLSNGTDYELTGVTPLTAAGQVTLTAGLIPGAAWPSGSVLDIRRGVSVDQPSAYGEGDGFDPLSSEQALDHVAREMQDAFTQLGRTVQGAPGDAQILLPAAAQRESTVFGFDGAGAMELLTYSQLLTQAALETVAGVTLNISPLDISTRDIASALTFGPSIPAFLRTAGLHAVGDQGDALYAPAASARGPMDFTTNGGAQAWRYQNNILGNRAAAFGVVMDGVVNQTSFVWTGSDNAAAIQAALNFASDYSVDPTFAGDIWLGQGAALISTTISLGSATSFEHVRLKGYTECFAVGGGIAGSVIGANFSDRPIVAITGGRLSGLANVFIQGPFQAWYEGQGFCTNPALTSTQLLQDDTNPATWQAVPGAAAHAFSITAPFAGIATDPFSGPTPSPAYPNGDGYGAPDSSQTVIRDVTVNGVAVGFVAQPSGAAGNSDFPTLERFGVNFSMYGISLCSTQMRNLVANSFKGYCLWCAVATAAHGAQSGKIGQVLDGVALSPTINIFDVAIPNSGPYGLRNSYTEGLYRFGHTNSGGSTAEEVVYEDSEFHLDLQIIQRGYPNTVLSAHGTANGAVGGNASVYFRNCSIQGQPAALVFNMNYVQFDGRCVIFSLQDQTVVTLSAALSWFHNATAGNVVNSNFNPRGVRQQMSFALRDVTTGALAAQALLDDNYAVGGRNYGVPIWARSVVPRLAPDPNNAAINPQQGRVWAIGFPTSFTYNHTTGAWTFSLGANQDYLETFGGANGDGVLEGVSVTLGVVTDVTYGSPSALTLQALNNIYTATGWTPYYCTPLPTSAGINNLLNSRWYTPPAVMYGTFTNGSNQFTVPNGQWSPSGANANELPQVGDRLPVDATGSAMPWSINGGYIQSTNQITAISVGGSLTTVTTAGNYTGHSGVFRIPFLIAAPPANL